MWARWNTTLRARRPRLHRALKRLLAPALQAGIGLPVPKRLAGERFLMHSRYLTQDLDRFEPHVRAWLHDTLDEGATFIDVGAFHGLHTLPAARRVTRSGRVVAFEPSRVSRAVLRYHIRVNRLRQVEVVTAVVGESDAEATAFYLVDGGDNASNSATFGRLDRRARLSGHGVTETRLPAVALDGYCRRTGATPDVIKIDVEGAELAVLRGAAEVLDRHRPRMMIAVHPFWMPDGDSPERLVALLHGHAYRVFDFGGREVETPEFGDYIALPRGPAA